MRPFDEKRLVIEYARIHRIVPDGQGLFPLPPFIDDFAGLLQQAIDEGYAADWRGHEWKLGNLSLREDTELSGQFGWSEEVENPNTPPPYRNGVWDEAVPIGLRGELAVFVVDAESQRVGITSRAGDVKTKGFCRALTTLLMHQEMSLRARTNERPGAIEWIVETVAEAGVFRSWVARVALVKMVSIKFHLPNPSPDDEIQPLVNVLREGVGTDGLLRISNDVGESVNPFGNELLAAGVAMQERDYASITAKGEDQDGGEMPFNSADHTAKDTVEDPTWSGPPSIREAVAMIFESIAARLRRESRNGD